MGVIRLAEALSNNEFTHEIAVFGTNLSLQQATGTRIPCHALGLDGPSYAAFHHLARFLRTTKADLIHVNNLAPWFDTALAARLIRRPCVQTFHGVEQGRLRFSQAKRLLFRTAARFSSSITAVAGPAADLLAELTGVERKAVQVIPNGIDTDLYHPARDQVEKTTLRRKLGLPLEGLLLGCVAALRPVKNHLGLIRAFAGAVRTIPSSHLVLVGEGALENELRRAVQEQGLADTVHFLGPRRDVPELLRAFDLFVLNSDTEGLSYSVLEAMASGLPLAVTDVGANPELIEHGRQGWLYRAGQPEKLAWIMIEVASKPEILPAMGRSARAKVVRSYGITAMADQYASLYRGIVDQK